MTMKYSENDVYVVFSDGSSYENMDRTILTYLYQPLIGAATLSVYYTLSSELTRNQFQGEINKIFNLIKILGMGNDDVSSCIKKLEAVGLLRTYIKQDGNRRCFLFNLLTPLTANEFLNNNVLRSFLEFRLGKAQFKETVKKFNSDKIDLGKYEEITHSFDEVFEFASPSAYEKNRSNEKKSARKRLIKNSFDEQELLNKLKEKNVILDFNEITKEDLIAITDLAHIYNLNLDEIVYYVDHSYSKQEGVNHDKLRSIVRAHYSSLGNPQVPVIIEKDMDHTLETYKPKVDVEHVFLNATPYERLKAHLGGSEPPLADIKIFEDVITQIGLPLEVTNVLIDYIIFSTNGNYNRSYVHKVASEWKIVGIKTVHEAITYAKKKYQEIQEYKMRKERSKKNNVNDVPNWVKNNSENRKGMTDEELARYEEEFNKLIESD